MNYYIHYETATHQRKLKKLFSKNEIFL